MRLSLKSLVGNLLFFSVMFLILTRILSVSSGAIFPVDIVSSDSMSPSLMTGDLVAWTPSSIHDVKVGDVIVYKSWLHWPDTKLVVHRVVEIRRDFGKIALVTKGDANPWTDQAGPHIPEPYVIADNFVGKAIMLGPVPLKIPWVGYVGILVNQGFAVLSQSTSSKGTMASIVVFLPLTVSMILLVVAVLLVPQRQKTLEEKIRFYILSERSLNLKKTAVFFFILLTVFLMIIHLFAYESVTGAVGVGEFASTKGMDLGALLPGQTGVAKRFPVVNPSVFPVKGVVFGRGGLDPFLHHVVFQVAPGQSLMREVTVTVPLGTATGSYEGEIAMYSSPLWVLFPDWLLLEVSHVDASYVVMVLDVLSAAFLTGLIILLVVVVAFLQEQVRVLQVSGCWRTSRGFLRVGLGERVRRVRVRVRQGMSRASWVNQVNLASLQARPALVGVLVVVPVFVWVDRGLGALMVAAVLAGVVAYAFRCRLREKIMLATMVSLFVSLVVVVGEANLAALSVSQSVVESLGLVMGILGVYLLAFAVLLAPLVLVSWLLARGFRNVKEQRDPLLVLEGGCDL